MFPLCLSVSASTRRSSNSSSNSNVNSAADEQPPSKKQKLVPNIAEELAKNRSPPANSHSSLKKQISISSLLSDPQPVTPVVRAPTIILPSQSMGNANIGESEKRDILIARTNSPVSVISDRSQGVLLKNPESSEKLSTLIRSVSSFEEVKHEEGISHAVVNRNGPTLPPISSFDKISANDGINDIREVIEPEIKEESAVKAPKPSAKNTKSNARTTGKATKATSRTKKEAVKKEPKSETNGKTEKTGRSKTTKTKADPKSKADPKGKSESKGKCEPKTKSDEECKEPKESICNTNNNSNSMAADGAAATSDSSLNTDTATNIIGGKSRQDLSLIHI